MATITDLQNQITTTKSDVTSKISAINAELDALKAQLGSGTVLQPADFDALIAAVQSISQP